jgi:hypothetical protein
MVKDYCEGLLSGENITRIDLQISLCAQAACRKNIEA